jgi:hypothetical protein
MIGQTTDATAVDDASPAAESASVQVDERVPLAEEAVHKPAPREIGGRDGPEPTRYGDWEKNGRCIDF